MTSATAAEKALDQLGKALRFARAAEDGDPELFEQFRNSVIQTFEYSWELTTKLLRRRMVEGAASEEDVTTLSFPDLLREAVRLGHIDSVERWLAYRTVRNKTSHGYEESFAAECYAEAPHFLVEAKELLARIASR